MTDVRPILAPFSAPPEAPLERSTVDRLRGKSRPDLAQHALAWTLSRHDPSFLSTREVADIVQRYGLSASEQAALRVWAYGSALQAFCKDARLTGDERKYLDA